MKQAPNPKVSYGNPGLKVWRIHCCLSPPKNGSKTVFYPHSITLVVSVSSHEGFVLESWRAGKKMGRHQKRLLHPGYGRMWLYKEIHA